MSRTDLNQSCPEYNQMREAYVEQMKKYFAGMYEGLDLSECEIEEEGDDDADDENPFKISDSESDDPFADGADFDPFLDYPGESNDIGGDAAPSQARMMRCCSPGVCCIKCSV